MRRLTYRFMLFTAMLFLLGACGGKAKPQPTVLPEEAAAVVAEQPVSPTDSSPAPTLTITPGPTETQPTATPSVPPATETPAPTDEAVDTPTEMPTAVVTPHERLVLGRALHEIGDCGAARREFAALLAETPTLADATEARYRLASCYLRDDAAAEAADVLAQLLQAAAENDPYRSPALFLQGEALAGLAKWPEAEESYRAYLVLAPEVASLTWQRIGALRLAAGNLPGAEAALTSALTDSPDAANTVLLRRALAGLVLAQDRPLDAVAQYDLIREGDTSGRLVSEMQLLAGNALVSAGDPAGAASRWQAAIDADPATRYAHAALVALLDADIAVDEYQRGVVDYHNGVYQLAIDAFERYRKTNPAGRDGAAWYYTGRSYLALGKTGAGLAELGNFIAAYPASPFWAEAWLAQARAQADADDMDAAVATYRDFAARRPNDSLASTALLRAAILQARDGPSAPVADAFLVLATGYPATDEGWRAYQAAGLIFYRLGDWLRAADVWRAMADAPVPPATLPMAYYWLGRTYAAAGEMGAARDAWEQAERVGPLTFYGLRAAEWAAGIEAKPVLPGGNVPLAATTASPAEISTALDAWLRGWAGQGKVELPASVLSSLDWQRGRTLLAMGLRSEALTAWERVWQGYQNDPWTLAALSLAFRDAGTHQLSLRCASRIAGLWPGGDIFSAPAVLQKLAYPIPFAELVSQQAARWELDPRLLAAIIRQESQFEWGATSVAGARGLMQVMPATAAEIADKLAWRDYEPGQAYWPYINVAFGAYYIDQRLEQFQGSLAAALAAYNGGPGNAAFWRELAPDDDDLMVALIGINETRVYVQAVWSHYEMYRRLYPE